MNTQLEQEIELHRIQWARKNYTPGDKILSIWHQTVVEECYTMNNEQWESDRLKARPYSVVENAGSDNPKTIDNFRTFEQAESFASDCYAIDELEALDVDIIKTVNGNQTTEY